jgi:hypothetical protein
MISMVDQLVDRRMSLYYCILHAPRDYRTCIQDQHMVEAIKLPEVPSHITWQSTDTIGRNCPIQVTNRSTISQWVRWLMGSISMIYNTGMEADLHLKYCKAIGSPPYRSSGKLA